jgi:transcriptional regulator NrdR family protein
VTLVLQDQLVRQVQLALQEQPVQQEQQEELVRQVQLALQDQPVQQVTLALQEQLE